MNTPATSSPGPGARERRVVIVGGNRLPFARAGGAYANATNLDMLTAAIGGLVARFGLQGERIGEVAAGAVLKHPRDFNLTREAVLGSPLAATTPAYDIQQACATGLEAVAQIAAKIERGQIESGIAGGTDSVSDSPISVSDGLRHALLAASRAKSTAARIKALAKIRPADLKPLSPGVDEPRTGLSMGEHQAITTAQWEISRAEQDEIALASHQRLAAAYDAGFFDDLVTPYRGLSRDENLRADSSLDKLGRLAPVFGKRLEAVPTMTAGNSTPLSDGASTVLLASEDWARERHLTPMARFVDVHAAAVDFVHGRDGLLMAPVYAVPTLLARHGLTLDDFDYVEIHEAFASTLATTLKAWADEDFCRDRLGLPGAFGRIKPERLNVHGSSLAAGHPFAATGGRIVATLAKQLSITGGRGLISICAAGGLGVAAILEAS